MNINYIYTVKLTQGAKIPVMKSPSIGLPNAPIIVLTAWRIVPNFDISKPKQTPVSPQIAAKI